jgi:ubiquinone/menaquinone biosynthesis C-methylase UbiE
VTVPDAAPVTERLSWVSEALHAAAAISAAHRLGLLAAVASGPIDVEQVARTCHTDARRTAVLLDALVAMGLVRASDGGRFEAAAADLSTIGAVAASGDLLVDAVRSGRAPLDCDIQAGAARVYPETVTFLAVLLAGAAEKVAHAVGGADRVLDVGAGAAPWSLAAARRNPRTRVTALDLPQVLPATRRAVAAAGCTGRFDYISGDAFEVAIPVAAYDLVLLGNVCHLFDDPTNRRLLRRLRPALREGGRIAIIDVLPTHDRAAERSIRLYTVGLMTRTSTGGVHGEQAYQAWLEDAGFGNVRVHEASRTPPMSVITGALVGR